MHTARTRALLNVIRMRGEGWVGSFHRKPTEYMAGWRLTVRSSSLGVEEEDALVHDATNGTSSRHQPTGQTT